jgi:hypothetical protein
MYTLIVEHIKNKILNSDFFWKNTKNIENNTNTSKIIYYYFFVF